MRWGLIGGLALGGLTLLVGPERVAAGLAQLRSTAQGVVDCAVDDPVALRRQLENLADEYPDRIAEVRGEIAEVDHQLAQLERDIEIAGRVVAYTSEDLTVLKTRVAKAEAAAEVQSRLASSNSRVPKVFIRFEGVRFDIDEAYGEAIRIGGVRETYRDRLAFDQQQLKMLGEQKARLAEILVDLEDDFNTYQAQLWNLDRQIDAIERNDRLIELMEEQSETLASYDRYNKVSNFHQIEAKLAELRTIQEAQIETLQKSGFRADYEKRARMDMDSDFDVEGVLDNILEEVEEEPQPHAKKSVAWAPAIVIE